MKVGRSDRVIVFFSGHGKDEKVGGRERGYLIPADGDPERLFATGVSMDLLKTIAERLNTRHVLFVADACYSGFIGFSTRSIKNKGLLRDLVRKPAIQILTAGTSGQQAIERNGNGLFTKILLRGLEGGADRKGWGWVELSSLGDYVRDRVYAESNGGQRPVFKNLSGDGDFVFVFPGGSTTPQSPTDLSRLKKEIEAEETRLIKAKEAKALRERLARLKRERERAESDPAPPPRTKTKQQATYLPNKIEKRLTIHEKRLIRSAKKEGGVTFIGPTISNRTAKILGTTFTKRYGLGSNFTFRSIRKGLGPTVRHIRNEIISGSIETDVHMASAPGLYRAASRRGAYLKLDSGYWEQDFSEMARRANQYTNYPYVVTPYAYTFQPIWNSACPGMDGIQITSYEDVLSPSLRGKTIVSDITKSFTFTNTAISLGEAGMDLNDLWQRLSAQNPVIETGTEKKLQMIKSCERAIDMWNVANRVMNHERNNSGSTRTLKIGYFKEGQVFLGNQIAILRGSPHENAGRLLVEFLMSKEGTDVVVAGEALYSFRNNYVPPRSVRPYMLDLNKIKLLGLRDWVGAQKKFKSVRSEWKGYFK